MITYHRISLLVPSMLLPHAVCSLPNSFPPGRKHKMVHTVLLKVLYYLSNPFFCPVCHITCKLLATFYLASKLKAILSLHQQSLTNFNTILNASKLLSYHTNSVSHFPPHQEPLNHFFTPPATLFYPMMSFGSM